MIKITRNDIEEKSEEVLQKIKDFLTEHREVYIELLTSTQYKSRKQNSTFHSLLDCFWDSGCSSFQSPTDMRFNYKKEVGLVEMFFVNTTLTERTKYMVWEAIKILPLETTQRLEVINLLKGKVEREHSWAIATKKQATRAIDLILSDMDNAEVITSKEGKHYEEILEGMNADNWWDRG